MATAPEFSFDRPVVSTTITVKDDSGENPSFSKRFFATDSRTLASYIEQLLIENHPDAKAEAEKNNGVLLKPRKPRGSKDAETAEVETDEDEDDDEDED